MIGRRFMKAVKAIAVIFVTFSFIKIINNSDDSSPQLELLESSGDDFMKTLNITVNDSRQLAGVTLDSPVDRKALLESVEYLNHHHKVLNEEEFGKITPDNVESILVIQVHNRPEYLKYLIESLSKARGIQKSLLVFSHDIHHNEINQLIKSINFTRAIQIVYPNNIQLFPNKFPGQDPNDCPDRISKAKAEEMKCNNWEWPDKYGNYRLSKLSQIKHHWWWKMNYVFDGIVKKYNLDEKYVMLLEEDHYVAPDVLYVLEKMIEHKEQDCEKCEVLCLGFYLKNYNRYNSDIDKLSVQKWFSSKHNMGMAINLRTWTKVRECSQFFCTYDDYNWDWSMLQVSLKCLKEPFYTIVAKSPRVIHVGDCGVHTHKCNIRSSLDNALDLFKRDIFFPQTLSRSEVLKRSLKPSKPNGGWGDKRDHELCINNTYPYNLISA
ncbi:unnamed protein product [Bursaphelenchus okinawaensis]|uniref:Alpha-1,6-mannosyl-glycoprotein 2-beta-N-acetylglucosaminyltransferase n=1 Tax=Bursaphelenchus okinawaensis TaxID=465554 RepID=A0A811KNL5_9BILA|nr:unnamed protein product [Bursaphelenchus okinawaensis]CAG9106827.1 unnamed protein product [Bursaphelenchus okinawaensis]